MLRPIRRNAVAVALWTWGFIYAAAFALGRAVIAPIFGMDQGTGIVAASVVTGSFAVLAAFMAGRRKPDGSASWALDKAIEAEMAAVAAKADADAARAESEMLRKQLAQEEAHD